MPLLENHLPTLAQRQFVRGRKGLIRGQKRQSISIQDETGKKLGEAISVDVDLAQQPSLIELLTRWRQENRESFLTQFTPTAKRTARWLQRYLEDDSRILYLIYEQEQPIGHYGFCNIHHGEAEGDNLLRGENTHSRSLMFFAQVWIIRQAFLDLCVRSVYVRVLSNNSRGLRNSQRIGFEDSHLERLQQNDSGDELSLVPQGVTQASEVAAGEPTLTVSRLEQSGFFARHAWLPCATELRVA